VFNEGQGILGLANANQAAEFPFPTLPWTVTTGTQQAAQTQFLTVTNGLPNIPAPPAFIQIVQEGRLICKFAIWMARSILSARSPNPQQDPLNFGYLVIGGGEEFFIGRLGPYQTVPLFYGGFYYLNLLSVRVATPNPSPPVQLPTAAVVGRAGNAIVDSGTNTLSLNPVVYHAVIDLLEAINPAFASLIAAGKVPNSAIDYAAWPALILNLQGEVGVESLVCTSDQYWQADAFVTGQAQCMLGKTGDATSLTVLGLTFLSGYYTIFNRSGAGSGTLSFARPLDFPSTLGVLPNGPLSAGDPLLHLS
jgi:hypothetical protein